MRQFMLLLGAAPMALAATSAMAAQATQSTADATDTAQAPRQGDSASAQPTPPPEEVEADREERVPGVIDEPIGPEAGNSVIVVTGLRRSLGTAAAIKRDSDSIVDVIVAQDIGKLPDDTASESLARIAGVQVDRFNDDATNVRIRGLAGATTTYNGREFFTAETRFSQLQDFPAQALAGIEVYKSATADIIEPGIAGLINVRTRRPFDFEGTAIAGGITGSYNDQSRKFDPSGNLLYSSRAQTGIGEVGILVNVTFAQTQYYNGVRYNDQNIITPSEDSVIAPEGVGREFYYPYTVGLYNEGGRRRRPSANASLQWRPAHNFEMFVDGIYQGYRGKRFVDNFNTDLRGFDPTLTNVVLSEDGGQAVSLTKSGGFRQNIYRSTREDYTNTRQVAAGAKWETGPATLSTDLAYTWSAYGNDESSLDSYVPPQTVNVEFDRDGGATFDFPDFDASDPGNYYWRGYFERRYRVAGDGWQWRGDLTLDTGIDFLHTLQFGARYSTRTASLRNGTRYANVADLEIPLSSLPIGDLGLTPDPFRGGAQGFTQYLAPSRGGVFDNQAKLRERSREALARLIATDPTDQELENLRDALASFQSPITAFDPVGSFYAEEDSYAAYAQGKYEFDLGSIVIDGLGGVRVVNTDGSYSGTSRIQPPDPDGDEGPLKAPPATLTPATIGQNYVDVLPNISTRIRFTPELQLRLAFTMTRERPGFGQLNPSLQISALSQQDIDPNSPVPQVQARGTAGNPNLAPLTSKNYDTSLEYYFSKTGFVSGAVFYRDLFGFITNYVQRQQDPLYGLIEVTQPLNTGKGHFLGVELNAQTFLDFLPGALAGFGISGNVTYLDGKYQLPTDVDPDSGSITYGEFVRIPNVSKWTYNAAFFYERDGLTARLSYNLRSNWVSSYRQDPLGGQYTGVGVRARDRLDFSTNYDLNEHLTVTATVNNILAKPFENFNNYQPGRTFPVDVREEGRYFGLGVRFRFGE